MRRRGSIRGHTLRSAPRLCPNKDLTCYSQARPRSSHVLALTFSCVWSSLLHRPVRREVCEVVRLTVCFLDDDDREVSGFSLLIFTISALHQLGHPRNHRLDLQVFPRPVPRPPVLPPHPPTPSASICFSPLAAPPHFVDVKLFDLRDPVAMHKTCHTVLVLLLRTNQVFPLAFIQSASSLTFQTLRKKKKPFRSGFGFQRLRRF